MPSLNKVMLMGNLTRDPELKYTPKGTAVAELSLAVNRTYSTDTGEKREEVTFVDVELWGRSAEIANEYLKKGRPVFIEGRLRLDQWDDKTTGQKRSRMRVVGESMQMLGSRDGAPSGEEGGPARPPARSYGRGPGDGGGGPQGSNPPQKRPTPPGRSQPDAELDPSGDGDDVPF
jgi:single-strand DNA-binding protein